MKKLLVALLLAGSAGVNVEAMDQGVRPFDFFGTRGSEQRSKQVRVKPESEVVRLRRENEDLAQKLTRARHDAHDGVALRALRIETLVQELDEKNAEIAMLRRALGLKEAEIATHKETIENLRWTIANLEWGRSLDPEDYGYMRMVRPLHGRMVRPLHGDSDSSDLD